VDIYCLIGQVLNVYWFILLARIILSWTTTMWSPPPALTPVIRFIYEVTEPVLAFFRRFIPPIGMIDISPIIIFIVLRYAASYFPC
jgi:YggT family protein